MALGGQGYSATRGDHGSSQRFGRLARALAGAAGRGLLATAGGDFQIRSPYAGDELEFIVNHWVKDDDRTAGIENVTLWIQNGDPFEVADLRRQPAEMPGTNQLRNDERDLELGTALLLDAADGWKRALLVSRRVEGLAHHRREVFEEGARQRLVFGLGNRAIMQACVRGDFYQPHQTPGVVGVGEYRFQVGEVRREAQPLVETICVEPGTDLVVAATVGPVHRHERIQAALRGIRWGNVELTLVGHAGSSRQ